MFFLVKKAILLKNPLNLILRPPVVNSGHRQMMLRQKNFHPQRSHSQENELPCALSGAESRRSHLEREQI